MYEKIVAVLAENQYLKMARDIRDFCRRMKKAAAGVPL
jgi:hypothetical protein